MFHKFFNLIIEDDLQKKKKNHFYGIIDMFAKTIVVCNKMKKKLIHLFCLKFILLPVLSRYKILKYEVFIMYVIHITYLII